MNCRGTYRSFQSPDGPGHHVRHHYYAGRAFAALTREDQARLVQAVQNLGPEAWYGMPAGHVWSLWTRYACTAFYAHPWAWNEIGFGGPAYPRGYLRLGIDRREPWETADHAPRDPVAHRNAVNSPGDGA
ncbi:gluconate 2-dehydrogenase subunit 3 family protein [Streptomyces sp. NPDC057543]|uniref:gluconate 2-dehydrogenase subunit 3 family protein n=1 Tax=Streptomyces sp. NPDC057543 TaxID=3346163 RepID=UPI0036CE75B0